MSRYSGQTDYAHGAVPCMGVLLTNLGTPEAPTPKALRRYLAEFLSDPRVIETPRPLWWPILHGIILNTRPRRVAHAYAKIWTDEGSPLLQIARRQERALQQALETRFRGPVQVATGMRYGNPSIAEGLRRLRDAGARRVLVFPLYPQYSGPTVGSTFDAVADALKRWRWVPELRMIGHYHDDPAYIQALADRIRRHWDEHGRGECLFFSFHGLPKSYFLAGDPYYCQCWKTARLTAEQLGLTDSQWRVTFQSRFGPQEWLQPYTDQTLRESAQSGLKSVDIVCPGFAADCLETLEEIAQLNRDVFLGAGGERYHYIPALNDDPAHIQMLADLVARHTQGWPETAADWDAERAAEAAAAGRDRALAQGAAR